MPINYNTIFKETAFESYNISLFDGVKIEIVRRLEINYFFLNFKLIIHINANVKVT